MLQSIEANDVDSDQGSYYPCTHGQDHGGQLVSNWPLAVSKYPWWPATSGSARRTSGSKGPGQIRSAVSADKTSRRSTCLFEKLTSKGSFAFEPYPGEPDPTASEEEEGNIYKHCYKSLPSITINGLTCVNRLLKFPKTCHEIYASGHVGNLTHRTGDL